MSKPTEGGSYVRHPDGTLERKEFTRPANADAPAPADVGAGLKPAPTPARPDETAQAPDATRAGKRARKE